MTDIFNILLFWRHQSPCQAVVPAAGRTRERQHRKNTDRFARGGRQVPVNKLSPCKRFSKHAFDLPVITTSESRAIFKQLKCGSCTQRLISVAFSMKTLTRSLRQDAWLKIIITNSYHHIPQLFNYIENFKLSLCFRFSQMFEYANKAFFY